MISFAGLPLTVKTNVRAKRVLVKLVVGQGLEVVLPPGFDQTLIPDILREKQGWIERTRDAMQAEGQDVSGVLPELPDTISFMACDRMYQVAYVDRPGRIVVRENVGRLLVSGPLEDRRAIFEALQFFTARKAREVLLPLLKVMSRDTGLTYAAFQIRRQKTRWGSCSARGTISLNAKLLFLPVELVDHLLLHELCHTRQMNHSDRYWALVESFQPDYRRLEHAVKYGGIHVPAWFV
ncbi:DUF45 domain-containing protein [Pseudodesulfovibrio sp. JC047]|uniref:M48 family metallopeptidase n=1 Tax=Pseudodesulfovibrio sp. JC047 TaxID=2683199 RepID=UPI0013D595DD|nr:SprT family zinc-dependent metalloprotease [Pseudodesulfovibrio sp. JC047]NDV20118.1 DUF45 domain-containing protein [Pseudodesulfovibrio sp. JC047]